MAEAKFRQAFERLKASAPVLLPHGAAVSQNNVAREAGCDPTALKKSRFPALVEEIKRYVAERRPSQPTSARSRLIKARQVARSKEQLIVDIKAQRDDAALKLVEAYEEISWLHHKIKDLEARIADLQSSATVVKLDTNRRSGTLRPMDISSSKMGDN